jgi:hypothetical protein
MSGFTESPQAVDETIQILLVSDLLAESVRHSMLAGVVPFAIIQHDMVKRSGIVGNRDEKTRQFDQLIVLDQIGIEFFYQSVPHPVDFFPGVRIPLLELAEIHLQYQRYGIVRISLGHIVYVPAHDHLRYSQGNLDFDIFMTFGFLGIFG